MNKTKEELHAIGEPCEDEACQECCPHEYEDGYCLNCSAEQDMGELIDAAEYIYGDR